MEDAFVVVVLVVVVVVVGPEVVVRDIRVQALCGEAVITTYLSESPLRV